MRVLKVCVFSPTTAAANHHLKRTRAVLEVNECLMLWLHAATARRRSRRRSRRRRRRRPSQPEETARETES